MRHMDGHVKLWMGAALAAALGTGCGCAEEREILEVRGGLVGLPGSQGGLVGSRPKETSGGFQDVLNRYDPLEESEDQNSAGILRRTNDDGTVSLISRSPRHVVYHLLTLLASEEEDLLFDQLLSDNLKEAYIQRGKDPREAVDFLMDNRDDIRRLLATIPMGEQTPGVLARPIGRNMFRLSAPSVMARDLRFKHFDVVMEGRVFRLLLIS